MKTSMESLKNLIRGILKEASAAALSAAKLSDCPVCNQSVSVDVGRNGYVVVCRECGSSLMGSGPTPEDAASAWNYNVGEHVAAVEDSTTVPMDKDWHAMDDFSDDDMDAAHDRYIAREDAKERRR